MFVLNRKLNLEAIHSGLWTQYLYTSCLFHLAVFNVLIVIAFCELQDVMIIVKCLVAS